MKKPRPTAQAAINAGVKEMRDLATMILQAIKPPPAPPVSIAWVPPKHHPLVLNPNEGMWMHHCVGPVEGWFSFGEHGNPPFKTPVQLLFVDRNDHKRLCVGTGQRTDCVDEQHVKEKWEVQLQFDPFPGGQFMTHWRFLSAPPASVKQPEPRP